MEADLVGACDVSNRQSVGRNAGSVVCLGVCNAVSQRLNRLLTGSLNGFQTLGMLDFL